MGDTQSGMGILFDQQHGQALVAQSTVLADIGPIVREPFRAGPAHFQIDGDELVTGGRWVIEVTAAVSRFEEATAEVEVLVGD